MPVEPHHNLDPSIAILYLLYPKGPGYQKQRPIRELHRILARLPGRKTVLYIDNSAPRESSEKLSANEYALSGDNTYREFSGWQRGLDFLRQQRLPADLCLFANDTLLAQSLFHRRLLNRAAVECANRHKAMVGKRMVLSASGQILGNPLIPYVRTHLFLAPRAALDELGSVVSLNHHAIDRLLLSAYDPKAPLFLPNAPISKAIQDYILFHLHSRWYRKKPYNEQNFADLRGKTISILNSLLLSMRVHELAYPLVSYSKVSRFLRHDPSPSQLRAEWIDGNHAAPAASAPASNSFWRPGSTLYRRVPEKMRAFSWENVLDFLERRAHPEHL